MSKGMHEKFAAAIARSDGHDWAKINEKMKAPYERIAGLSAASLLDDKEIDMSMSINVFLQQVLSSAYLEQKP